MSLPTLKVPVAEYAPDLPSVGGKSANVMNVFQRTPISYGPLGSPSPLTSALPTRCQGAYFGLDSSANVNGFAGDSLNLWRFTANATSWSNVSKSANAYGISSSDQWHFCLYGIRVIATDYADNVQSFVLGQSTTFADLITTSNPPKARFCCVAKSFLVLADTSDATYGAQRQRIWWSRNGNPTAFDDPGANAQLAAQFETSYQDLLGEGGPIMGIVGNLGQADLLIFQQHAVFRGVWVGSPNVFDFFPMEGVRGCIASGSIAQLGGQCFYLGEDDFYLNDGAQSIPIGANKIAKTFFADLDQNYLNLISSAIDPINKLYIVFYPGSGHNGSSANKMLMCNWQLGYKWSVAIPLAFGGDLITRALSFGYTLDQIYTVLGYKLDTMPFPLDSRVWQGGSLLLGIFDASHRLNFFTGTPLAATVETAEIQPFNGRVGRIINSRPIVDGLGTVPSVAIATRNRQMDQLLYGNAVAMDSLGQCPQRAVGRYLRGKILVSSSSWTNISGLEVEGSPAGVRY